MQDFTPSKEIPKRIIWGTRSYKVLGYYKAASGKSMKTDKTKVVLLNEASDDKVITDWPTKNYPWLVNYEEIW